MTNPFVFVVGCPRSGTTLMGRMLDAHPGLAIIHESRWIAKFFEKRIGLTNDGRVTPELLKKLKEHPRFTRLNLDTNRLEALIARAPIDYASFTTALFDLYGEKEDKPLVGDKTPRYVRAIETLNSLWPRVLFVHIIRDGRDTCLSILNWSKGRKGPGRLSTWAEDPLGTSALWWCSHVERGREAGRALGPERYLELKYEQIVERPAESCSLLCDFLEIPYDEAMLNFHEGRAKPGSSSDAKKAWLPITQGLRDWRTQMEPEQMERFEAIAGELLDELGYERATTSVDPRVANHARGLRESFVAELVSRGSQLPESWSR